jgi:hypothetical protein
MWLVAITVANLVASRMNGQEACPCVPQTKLWTSSVCDTLQCVSTALKDANGDPALFALPIGMSDRRWLLVRQVSAGGYVDNSPFVVESFDDIGIASARLASLTTETHPKIITAPDGRLLVLSLREPETRRRAVVH